MEKSCFSKVSRGELKRLILKSIPYSGSIGKQEDENSITYSTRLFFLNAHLVCTHYKKIDMQDSCAITDLETGETLTVFDSEADQYLCALAVKRIDFAGKSEFDLHKKKRGFEECKKLNQELSKIARIIKSEQDGVKYLEIEFPRKLKCKKGASKELGISCSSKDIDFGTNGFEGTACWDLLEERLAKLEKEEAELK
jgi:uncharacterized protein YqfB (UPF0267 family)